jgi:hypothetical protein
MGASTSWNPKGLSRPVMGLLYIYLKGILPDRTIFVLKCGQLGKKIKKGMGSYI